MEKIRSYLLALVAASLIVSLLQSLGAKGAMRRVLALGCGLFICIVMLKPVLQLELGELSAYIDHFALSEDASAAVQEENRQLAGQIIKEQTQTYILDKAAELGMQVGAEVHLRALSDSYSYPYEVVITGSTSPAQKQALSEYISEILGIPGERQTWNPTIR